VVDGAMLQVVASVGAALRIETVAEGVETEAQAAALFTAGVRVAQGYLFARPMAAPAVSAWLNQESLPRDRGGTAGWVEMTGRH